MCGEGCCMMPISIGHHNQFSRRFFTKEEKIKQLKQYLADLEIEIKAVEEIINEMK